MRSLRFFPNWNLHSGDQVYGFIEMMFYIYSMNNDSSKHYVELGSYIGESALLAGSFPFIGELTLIDFFGNEENLVNLKNRLKIVSKNKKVNIIAGDSTLKYKEFKDESIDILYIDANHEYEYISKDLNLWKSKVKIGGFIAGHDYYIGHPGVIKAVDEFVEKNNKSFKKFSDCSFAIHNI